MAARADTWSEDDTQGGLESSSLVERGHRE